MNRRRRIVYVTGALIGLLLLVGGVGAAVGAVVTLVVVWALPPINTLAVAVWVSVDALTGACAAVWWLTRPLRLDSGTGAPV